MFIPREIGSFGRLAPSHTQRLLLRGRPPRARRAPQPVRIRLLLSLSVTLASGAAEAAPVLTCEADEKAAASAFSTPSAPARGGSRTPTEEISKIAEPVDRLALLKSFASR